MRASETSARCCTLSACSAARGPQSSLTHLVRLWLCAVPVPRLRLAVLVRLHVDEAEHRALLKGFGGRLVPRDAVRASGVVDGDLRTRQSAHRQALTGQVGAGEWGGLAKKGESSSEGIENARDRSIAVPPLAGFPVCPASTSPLRRCGIKFVPVGLEIEEHQRRARLAKETGR